MHSLRHPKKEVHAHRGLDATLAEFVLRAPPGLGNHILWYAGHSYVVVEALTMRALGRPPEIPEGWFEMFSWDSRPALIATERWPILAEVFARLLVQHERLRGIIGGLSGEQLDRPSAGNPARTVGYAILHGLHDEAGHLGEAYLLLKMQTREGASRFS